MAEYLIGQRRSGSGILMPGISGEALLRGSAIYMSAVDGLWYLADSDAAATMPVVGVSSEQTPAGSVFQIITVGLIGRAGWTWTRGDPLYISGTAGILTQTAPIANTQAIGVAITATLIYVDVKNAAGIGSATGCALLEGATAYVGFDTCKEPYTNYFLCDGTADDVQIQQAVDYIDGLGEGGLYAEAGTYTAATEAVIDVPSNIVIEGSSDKTVTFDNIRFEHASTSVDSGDVVFRNFRVIGDDIEHAISIVANDCTVSNVLVENIEATITKTIQAPAEEVARGVFHLDVNNTAIIENVRFINCKALACSTFGFLFYDNIWHIPLGVNIIRDVWLIACEAIGCGKAVGRLADWVTGFDFAEGNANLTVENVFAISCKATGSWESGFHQEWLCVKNNIHYINCTSNGNGLDKPAPTFASGFYVGGDSSVTDCMAYNNGGHGIHLANADYAKVTGSTSQANAWHGILLEEADYCNIENNILVENDNANTNTYDGIKIDGNSTQATIVGNTVSFNDHHGINLDTTSNHTVVGNTCYGNGRTGILVDNSPENAIMGNNCGENTDSGISVTGGASTDNICTGNTCNENLSHGVVMGGSGNTLTGSTCNGNIIHGIGVYSSTGNTITGNTFNGNVRRGIHVTGSSGNTIVGNTCSGNDLNDAGLYDGIHVDSDSDDNFITGNTCNDNDRYGIRVNNANCQRNWIKDNMLSGNISGPFSDAGVDTKLATKTFQFIAGGDVEGTAVWASFVSATASAKGWSVAGADDWAVALSQLPLELQQIVRFKIWAVALGAPINAGGQMHLEIVMNAGADNLAFTTEPVALVNFDGETTDYVNTDVVHWVVDSGDDADIGSMVGGMSIEVKVIYEVGADPDGATNAVFRTVEIEYV